MHTNSLVVNLRFALIINCKGPHIVHIVDICDHLSIMFFHVYSYTLVPQFSALKGLWHGTSVHPSVGKERRRGQHCLGRLASTQCPIPDHKHRGLLKMVIIADFCSRVRGQWQWDQYSSCWFVDPQTRNTVAFHWAVGPTNG